jgi:hypothetical protein
MRAVPTLDRQMVKSELRRWERELIDGDAGMDLGIKQAVSSITDDNEIEAIDLEADSLVVRADYSMEIAGTVYVELRLGGKSGVRLHEAFPIVLEGHLRPDQHLEFSKAIVNTRSWTG